VHLPSRLVAVSRDNRSQHRNKAQALSQLEAMLVLASVDADMQMPDSRNH